MIISSLPPSSYTCVQCARTIPATFAKKCSKCCQAIYCGPLCQNKDWGKHRVTCISPNELGDSKKDLSPFEFALVETGETEMAKQISKSRPKDIEGLLEERGYRAVFVPQKGDLVLFVLLNQVSHMGVVLDNGRIHSKLATDVTFSNKLPLKTLCDIYGETHLFYRKRLLTESKSVD